MKNPQLVHRLSRIQGQIEALRRIVASGETDCLKTIELAKAASNAIRKFAQAYVEEHLDTCIEKKRALKEVQTELRKVIQSAFLL